MVDKLRVIQLSVFLMLALGSYAVYEKYYSTDVGVVYEPFTKGYSLEGVVIQTTDETGQIVSTIESPSVVHYADTEISVIEDPKYTIHQATGDWLFKSDRAEVNKSQTELYFPNQVELHLDVVDAVTIDTSILVVNLQDKKGFSDEKIMMRKPGTMLTGVGSVINFKEQEIEILNEMYAEFKN